MLVTESGMVTVVRLSQPPKAPLPMCVTESSIAYSVSLLPAGSATIVFPSLLKRTPSMTRNEALPGDTLMEVRLLHDPNAAAPMYVTESPIVTVFRLRQAENAADSTVVTEFGIDIAARFPQAKNAASPMLVTESGILIVVRLPQY